VSAAASSSPQGAPTRHDLCRARGRSPGLPASDGGFSALVAPLGVDAGGLDGTVTEHARDGVQIAGVTHEAGAAVVAPSSAPTSIGGTVFIVHGRDEGAKESVARVISNSGLDPVILAEQPNQGMTLIEKLERYGKPDFAVVLF